MLHAALDVADTVLLTEEEAEPVTGVAVAEGDADAAIVAARSLLAHASAPTTTVIVKRGAAGALLVRRDGADAGSSTVTSRPAPSVDVADTVGCGDSFAAAIALADRAAAPPGVALALANAVGAATATRHGAGRAVADPRTVAGLLESDAAAGDADAAAALALLHDSRRLAGRDDGVAAAA